MLTNDRAYWYEQYHTMSKSLAILAEENNTYPNRIRRHLIKLEIHLKTKSEAQKEALEIGRHKHPTRGTCRDLETRNKIGDSLSDNWKNKSEAEKLIRVEKTKSQWANMPDEQKEELQRRSAMAVRETSTKGSRLERYLFEHLTTNDIRVEFHKNNLLANQKMQLDLYMPDLATAIEVDGPTHYLPIWGEELLQKHQKADHEKNALLALSGYNVIRIQHLVKTVSDVYERRVFQKLMETIEYIKANQPLDVENRIIFIGEDDGEIKNRR